VRRLSQRKSAEKPREKRVARQHAQQSGRAGAMHVTGEEEEEKEEESFMGSGDVLRCWLESMMECCCLKFFSLLPLFECLPPSSSIILPFH